MGAEQRFVNALEHPKKPEEMILSREREEAMNLQYSNQDILPLNQIHRFTYGMLLASVGIMTMVCVH